MDRKWMKVEWKRVLFGGAVSVVLMLALTGLGAWMVSKEWVDIRGMNYLSAGILLVSAAIGAAAGKGENPLNGLLSGVVFWFVLLVLNAVLFDGAMPGLFAVLAAIIGGTAGAMLVCVRPKGGRHGRRHKYRHR